MRMKRDATEKPWAAEGAQSTLAPSLFPDITPSYLCAACLASSCHWEFQALYFLFLMTLTSQHCVLSLSGFVCSFLPESRFLQIWDMGGLSLTVTAEQCVG